MKIVGVLFFFLFFSTLTIAQQLSWFDKKIIPGMNSEKESWLFRKRSGSLPDLKFHALPILLTDSSHNMYGDLLNDDPEYNIKYPWWRPALGVVASNALLFAVDRYLMKFDYSTSVGTASWNRNIKSQWEWDSDKFGINFIGHPYSGALYFSSARADGYNYLQSIPYAVGGSLMWEYFGENTLPSYNDVVNTSISGAFLGEMLYRISSNILDDRTKGTERFFRELSAGIIDPVRGLNRLLQGKSFRVLNKEVYQKEPLNITLFAGIRRNDKGRSITGDINPMVNIQLDYGNPFEVRSRKAYDFFKVRVDLNYGKIKKIVDNVTGYGILAGRNFESGERALLVGAFQYYDYWDNKTFELGSIGFGGGIISKVPVYKHSNLYTSLHIGIVPIAGNSTKFLSDTSLFRDYNFGAGLQSNFESNLNINKYVSLAFVAYYYWIHTYVGSGGNNFIGIIKPKISVRLFKNLSIGYEYFEYISDRVSASLAQGHVSRNEQKLFLLLYLEDPKRKGHYN